MVNERLTELRHQLYIQKNAAYRCAKVLASEEIGEIQSPIRELFLSFRELLVGRKEGSSTALKDVVRPNQVDGLIATIDQLLAGESPSVEKIQELRYKLEMFREDRRDWLRRN